MALKTFVKISNVSSLSDARYCAGMGVDQLGFNLNPLDLEAITPDKFIELKDWIAGVKLVGEFGETSFEELKDIQMKLPIDIIEIGSVHNVEKVHLLGKPVSVSLDIWNQAQLNQLKSQLSYLDELVSQVIINSNDPLMFDEICSIARNHSGKIMLIKAFDVTVDSITSPMAFKGFQLKATHEEKPGFKDYGLIMDLLEAIEVE
jgi:phosphoribosylanthranilate isomerase